MRMAAHIMLLGSTSAQHKHSFCHTSPAVATGGFCRGMAHEKGYKSKQAQAWNVSSSMQSSNMGASGSHLCAILVGDATALLLQQGEMLSKHADAACKRREAADASATAEERIAMFAAKQEQAKQLRKKEVLSHGLIDVSLKEVYHPPVHACGELHLRSHRPAMMGASILAQSLVPASI